MAQHEKNSVGFFIIIFISNYLLLRHIRHIRVEFTIIFLGYSLPYGYVYTVYCIGRYLRYLENIIGNL